MDANEVAGMVADRLLQNTERQKSIRAVGTLWAILALAPPLLLGMSSDWGAALAWWAGPVWGLLVFGAPLLWAALRLR